MMNRRQIGLSLAGLGLVAASPAVPAMAATGTHKFPAGFLWGASTSAYQVEGNNINSDVWTAERAPGSPYADVAGDAANSFALWPVDLDLVRNMGLTAYRFSLEWARIEPRPGEFSIAMLDHYKRIIEGCHTRGLTPMVTFNHFSNPLWFALAGGWHNPEAPALFARFCAKAAAHLGDGIAYAATLNEPNHAGHLPSMLPPSISDWLVPADKAACEAVAKRFGVPLFLTGNNIWYPDPSVVQANLLKGHALGRQAIKSERSQLPVGVTLAMIDDQAVGRDTTSRDNVREKLYAPWLRAAQQDDYVGVQNYERALWDAKGRVQPPAGGDRNMFGAEVYPASLAGVVRYAHAIAQVPVIVTEHGVNSPDDGVRQRLIPAALKELHRVMADGVPVKGYFHWSLIDNFEWGFGYKPQFGLHSLDRQSFTRIPKPSAAILGSIGRANAC